MNVNDLIPFLSENIGSLLSAVGSAAGAIFTVIFLRKNTAAAEFEKIKAGKLGEVADELLDSGKMSYTEYYKAKNFLKIAEMADDEYSKMPHGERTSPYDFDWFIRFYEAAGSISNEQMQSIWAKILAGEINKPDTYSLRTIDLLRTISQKEANLFKRICSHCVCKSSELFLPRYDKYLEACQITLSEVLYLSELGLINSDSELVYRIPIDSSICLLFENNALVITASSKDGQNKYIAIPEFKFTTVGNELASLLDICLPDEEFILFAKELASIPSVNINVRKILNKAEGMIQLDDEDLLEID